MKIKYIQGKKFKLNMNSGQRWHLVRNRVTQLVTHDRIRTTNAKCRHITPTVERLIALGKRVIYKDESHLRKVIDYTQSTKDARNKFYDEIIPVLKEIEGSGTRIVKLENRKGDNSSMSYIEFKNK